jgi:signal transduction histidine kinase
VTLDNHTGNSILIVDDTLENLRILSQVLIEHGYRVRAAKSGREALASMQANLPDLVLLDVRMPDMDGYEVCTCLKADPAMQSVPVLFISALDETRDKLRGFEVGGVDYITKPFQPAEVLVRVRTHLEISRLQTALKKDTEDLFLINEQLHAEIDLRIAAEVQLNTIMQDLQRSNADLQTFAHTVSHDLQEPLRMVTSYLGLLEQRTRQKLDPEALEFIRFATDGANRMQKLIKDILAYSRVDTQGKTFAATECEIVLEKVLLNLKSALAESGARITHDPLPQVYADATQLEQIFQNLIGNAIKFKNERQPVVVVQAEKKESQNGMEWVFSVTDNGIGIDPQYFDGIFAVFKRLHSREEYPGTGIGLAICQRIVERHGGRIWVESTPGQGSTFFFTLPVISQAQEA